jgi:hypothetical protein
MHCKQKFTVAAEDRGVSPALFAFVGGLWEGLALACTKSLNRTIRPSRPRIAKVQHTRESATRRHARSTHPVELSMVGRLRTSLSALVALVALMLRLCARGGKG